MSKDPSGTITLTSSGLFDLQQEVEELKNVKMPKVVDRIATAREQGDLSENADYASAKDEQAILQARIDELEEIISKAKVVNGRHGGVVSLGSTVIVQPVGKKQQLTYNIVGEYESDPAEGKISVQSPVAKALIGKSKGIKVEVNIPAGKIEYEIIEVK